MPICAYLLDIQACLPYTHLQLKQVLIKHRVSHTTDISKLYRDTGLMAKSRKKKGKALSKPCLNELAQKETCPANLRGAILVCVGTLICLLPFIFKAFNIDEPLFVWAAKHIAAGHHLNPYGFQVNWYGWNMPMFEVTKNPPFACYYIALAGTLFGWSEVALHTAMLIPAIAAILGTYLLAARFCRRPIEAAFAAMLTPVFLVSSTAVMSDTLMLAFFVWAVFVWVVGLEKDKHSYLALSAVLVGVCALTKYYGGVLIGLLFVYSFLKKRQLGWWIAHFLITVSILVAYQLITKDIYGRGLLLDAASYATAARKDFGLDYLTKALICLSFTGRCLACMAFYAGRIFSNKGLILGTILTVLLILTLPYIGAVTGIMLSNNNGVRWGLAAQLGLMIVLGFGILALAITDFTRRRDAESVMLAMWVIGTYIFATFFNWTVNGRTILPMVPAVGILMMRCIDDSRTGDVRRPLWLPAAPLIVAAILALLVTWSDFTLANIQKEAAIQIKDRYAGIKQTVWYEGHWGFQYYMDEIGFKAIDFTASDLALGDIIVIPKNNTNTIELPGWAVEHSDIIELGAGRPLTTMSGVAGAGFYWDAYGPLPYAFCSVPTEQYYIFKMTAVKLHVSSK